MMAYREKIHCMTVPTISRYSLKLQYIVNHICVKREKNNNSYTHFTDINFVICKQASHRADLSTPSTKADGSLL